MKIFIKILKKIIGSYSLNFLDIKMLRYLNYDNGYFIECGANDGIRQSNTLYYEKKKNWKGILIEPSEKFYELKKNRSSTPKFYNGCCVSKKNHGKLIELDYLNLMTNVVKKKNKKSNLLKNKAKKFMTSNEKNYLFKVKGLTIDYILKKSNSAKLIDFFSLDVEGSEFDVLNGINFKNYNFKYFLIETKNFKKLNTFLIKKNYKFIKKLSLHDYLFKFKF